MEEGSRKGLNVESNAERAFPPQFSTSLGFLHTLHNALNAPTPRLLSTLHFQVGAICLSVSLPAVDDDKWGLLAVEQIRTSWGSAKLYIHEKLAA